MRLFLKQAVLAAASIMIGCHRLASVFGFW